MSNCQSDFLEKEMIDTVFHNCDQDSNGRVSKAKLLNYLKQLIGNKAERQHDLDELSALFTSIDTQQTIDIKAYRQAMDEWMAALHQPGENSFELLTQIEGLKNHNNQLTDDILRYRHRWETAEEALATALQENIELIKKIKRLQRIVDQKECVQRENEELKATMSQALQKHADEEKHYTKDYNVLLKKHADLENKLEQNILDYQQCEIKIQDLKVEHARMWQKEKKEIEELTHGYEQEIMKLKTELKRTKEQEVSKELTNKELRREKQDLVAQLMQLQDEQKIQPCEKKSHSSLPNAIENFDKSLVDSSIEFEELSDKILCSMTVSTLRQELDGMVDGILPSPICEREHLTADISTIFSTDSEDSLCYSLETFKDILISTVATAIEIKDQLSEFQIADFKSCEMSSCNCCYDFRMKVAIELSQYQDWLSLLLNKKTEVDVRFSKLVKILKDDNSLKKCTQDDADLKIVHDIANDNIGMLAVELKEFETLCVALSTKLQQLNTTNVKHQENIEETVWKILRKYFFLESGDIQVTNATRANLAISEKSQRAELKLYDDHHGNSKLPGEYAPRSKPESSDLVKIESPHSSSTELWKDEISKEIEELQQQLHKKQAVFAALTSGRLSHSWSHQRPSCSCQATPPPTPLVDALTIDLFDSGSLSYRNKKTRETLYNLSNSESYNRDHAISCPALDEKSNLVANATQTDHLGCHLSYGYLNSSNSSSTSGVIDVDFCSSSSRSQDGRKKRKNFIRSSHRFESDSQTSQSMESNPETNISLPRQRSPSFRAAIESHSNNRLQPTGEDVQLHRRNNSFMAAVGSHVSTKQQHNETAPLTRNRSLSFQAAIEDGQQSPVAENNEIDFISTSADTTPEKTNIPEGFTLDTHGRVVQPSARQDSRSVNFQLNHVDSCSGGDLPAVGNLQQSSKTFEDSKNQHSSHNSQKKSEEWKKITRTVPHPDVEVTYASPTGSIESSGSDVPKKSCIRDSSQRFNSSTEGIQSSGINEASPSKATSTAVIMENSSTAQPSSPQQIHSRTRRMSTHTLDVTKENLTSEEKSDPKMLKLSANKEKLLSLQKHKEAMSTSIKATGDVITNKNPAVLETAVNKPDDISNNALWTPDNNSQLSKLRENNLARKREQMKHMKMPELTELVENPSEGSETSKSTSVVNSSGATFTQPPPPTDNMVLPSIPDSFLMELGLFVDQYANFCCEDLSEQETENKFLSLSLAFKTDKLTLNQRLQIQKNSRDLAEENFQKELNSLKEASESMVQHTNDPQVRETVNNIQHFVEILQQAVARISGRAEVFGAVQQEQRMSQAMEVMLAYVENLRRMQERDHMELEEAKKALTENKILSIEDGGDSSTLPRRTASLFNSPSKNVHRFKALTATSIAMASAARMMETTKRRASVAAVSKNPVPMGSTPGYQASMGILSRQEGQRSTLPPGRLLRRVSSFEKSSTIYDENYSDREGIVDRQVKENKDQESERSAFQKGYKKGLSTQVNSMIDNLANQQSCMVQEVQKMMANNDMEDSPEEKLAILPEVIADIQNDVISMWKGLNPFTQYASIGFFFFLAMFAIIIPILTRYSPLGKINLQVTSKYYTGPPT